MERIDRIECVDCNLCTIDDQDNFVCLKFNKIVQPFSKCVINKVYDEEEYVRDVYLRYYKKLSIPVIAEKVGWGIDKMRYFIERNVLPMSDKRIRKRKV